MPNRDMAPMQLVLGRALLDVWSRGLTEDALASLLPGAAPRPGGGGHLPLGLPLDGERELQPGATLPGGASLDAGPVSTHEASECGVREVEAREIRRKKFLPGHATHCRQATTEVKEHVAP
jgi:hypothetical protein